MTKSSCTPDGRAMWAELMGGSTIYIFKTSVAFTIRDLEIVARPSYPHPATTWSEPRKLRVDLYRPEFRPIVLLEFP